jgi:hypothetical protein
MMRHKLVPIIDPSSRRLSAEALEVFLTHFRDPPCVFVGSGISIWPPSHLPSGQGFTNAMFSLLFESIDFRPSEKNLLAQLFGQQPSQRFSGIPFEHLMECCPFEDKANTLINRLYDSRRFNELHRALAQVLKEGKINSIITTNYDCCLDEALEGEAFPFIKVVTDSQARDALRRESVPCYFKIHGSIEKGLEQSPMYSLKHEGLLHPDKRRLLRDLVAGRSLLMIGYSGLDFELCPEIERLQFKQLIWNGRTNDYPSVSARRVIEKKAGTLLYGDMRQLMKNWLGIEDLPPDLPELSAEEKEAYLKLLTDLVQQIFSDEELRVWGIRVLNSLGAPSLAFRILATLPHSSNPFVMRIENGRAEFHSGRYKEARRWYKRAFLGELASWRLNTAADSALELSDAYRTFGSPIRGYVCTWIVDLFVRKSLRSKKLLKQSLVIKNILEISSSAKTLIGAKVGRRLAVAEWTWDFVNEVLEAWLTKKIIECGREAQQVGNWTDFQQLALVAEELGIDIKKLATGDYYLPPHAEEGYRHLGYYIPQSMIFFTQCRKDNTLLVTSSGRADWRHHVRTCKQLGVSASLWKILALSESTKTKIVARHTFRQCEYSFLKALFDWKKFSGEGDLKRSLAYRRSRPRSLS